MKEIVNCSHTLDMLFIVKQLSNLMLGYFFSLLYFKSTLKTQKGKFEALPEVKLDFL